MFSLFIGGNIDFSGSVNFFFSGVEVSEFLGKVGDLLFQTSDGSVVLGDFIVNNS